ncbi:MAG: ABC transporter ATP-binding protein [Candidatus Bathyarchaeota archaeon]|nr:ABC transporter ATP-binding protein [Candidatus Bathyarchaeota archaeon]MDH5746146.1 ABC transporter ATP-binding protein [Candidatus Bathyarchaeota archaeon]
MNKTILQIKDLKTYFYTDAGIAKAVDELNLKIERKETLGLIGESGSGKTVTALSILRLVPFPGRITGEILFHGENLLEKSEEEMRSVRGGNIAMIFQDPMTSLNPVYTIGNQISEAIELHQDLDRLEVNKNVIDMLKKVGIPDAATRQRDYPHQFSGGMRQRVMIAMALSCNPELLIADEATTNLDVTVQAEVLELMKNLKEEFGSSILLITHDLGVVAEMSDKVAVLYAGKLMEFCDVETAFMAPQHPYLEALLESIPRLDVDKERLDAIAGTVPELVNPPQGCRFHPRCKYAKEICNKQEPQLIEIEPGHSSACLRVDEIYH